MKIRMHNVCIQPLLYVGKFLKQLFLRKEMGLLQVEIETHNRLRRSVTPIQMLALGIGAIIGTGIFVLSGQGAANFAGPSIIISFILAGIVALLTALSMSEMSAMMASSGSAYTYVYVALGEYIAFIIGWLSILNYLLGSTGVVVSWSRFVLNFIDLISDFNVTSEIVEAPIAWSEAALSFHATGQVINIPAVAITILITIILIIGIRETAIFNLVFVIIKVIILLIFIFACCGYVDRKNYDPFFPSNMGSFGEYGFTGMLHASTFVFFAYVGFETITAVAQEARTPSRTQPIALILSVVISLLIYVGVATVMVGLVPYQTLNSSYPLTIAIYNTTPFSDWLPIVLTVGGICSLTTVALVILLAQSRILYAMACDGLLPKIFTKIQLRTKTPWVAILVCGSVCAVLSSICPVDILGETTSISALITYLFVHISVIVMYYTHEDMPRSFRVPFGQWLIPLVGILLCILLLVNTNKGTAIRFGIWIGVGQIVYFGYGFRHSKARLQMQQGSCNTITELFPPQESIASNASSIDLEREEKESQI